MAVCPSVARKFAYTCIIALGLGLISQACWAQACSNYSTPSLPTPRAAPALPVGVAAPACPCTLTSGEVLARTDLLNELITEDPSAPISVLSSSFAPPNNSLLVIALVVVNGDAAGSGDVTSGITVSGGGLTWTRRVQVGGNLALNYTYTTEIWTAPVVTGSSMNLTLSSSAQADADPTRLSLNLMAFTGYDTSTPTGATASQAGLGQGAETITLSGSPATSSAVVAARTFIDSNTDDSGGIVAGSGWTKVYDSPNSSGYGNISTQVRTGSTSTTVAWQDMAVNSVNPSAMVGMAVEIKAAP